MSRHRKQSGPFLGLVAATVAASAAVAFMAMPSSAQQTARPTAGQPAPQRSGQVANPAVRAPWRIRPATAGHFTRNGKPYTPPADAGIRSHADDGQFDLTVNLTDRDGAVASPAGESQVLVISLDNGERWLIWGSGQLRLPAGRYAVHGTIETPRTGQEPTYSFISQPELRLDRDTVQTLDARAGKPVSITPDNPAARGGTYAVSVLDTVTGCGCTFGWTTTLDPRFNDTYAATVAGTGSSTFAFAQSRRAVEPDLELVARAGSPFEVAVTWLGDPPPAQRATLVAVSGGRGTPEDLAKIDANGKLVVIEVPSDTTFDEVYQRIAAIKKAGGTLAMVDVLNDPSGAAVAAPHDSGGSTGPALPTLFGDGVTAQRFTDLVKAAEVGVSYVNRPLSDVRYELMYGVAGRVTTAQVHRPRTSDLVAVQTSYHDNVAESSRYVTAQADYFGTAVNGGPSVAMKAPARRTEYFTPGTWTLESDNYEGPRDSLTDTLRLAAGGTYQVVWNKAVAGPTFRGTARWGKIASRPWAWRDSGAIDVILPMYGDAGGRPRVPYTDDGTDTGSISLYRDGTLVRAEPVPDAARFDVPADPATYRLVAEANRASAWWPLPTKVSAEWTFRSSAANEGTSLPLLTARFDPAVDLHNRAPGGRTFTLPAYVERQSSDTVNVTTFAVDVSYDDGRTWQPASVNRSGDHWTVSVRHPATGYASLRATATDTHGNSVRQTVLRAYQIGE
ncbi:hypothetical protein [Dactylosporangium sp. NPDC049140]|uniref:hypothetical protein n=1 Tax=Dactylosporangium sp. NPDC049140 TaxID=3155647 RepID=UPI0033DE8C1E